MEMIKWHDFVKHVTIKNTGIKPEGFYMTIILKTNMI